MPEIETPAVVKLIRGKRIAIVGNSTDALKHEDGAEIDDHDVVIRMNSGAPDPSKYGALGRKTTVQTLGTLNSFLDSEPYWCETPKQLWWMKNTAWGDNQFSEFINDNWSDVPIWRYPKGWYQRATKEYCAHPLSSGSYMLWAMADKAFSPKSIDIYGMSFFGADGSPETWWQGERSASPQKVCPHDGQAEFRAFLGLSPSPVKIRNHWRLKP